MVLGKYIITGGLLLALGVGTALAGQGYEKGKELTPVAAEGQALQHDGEHRQQGGQNEGQDRGLELTAEQRQIVERIMSEARPKVRELREKMRKKMQELHTFAYRDDGDEEVLSRLGGELQALRDELRKELIALDERLEREAGLPARPFMGRGCSDLATRSPAVEGGERQKQ